MSDTFNKLEPDDQEQVLDRFATGLVDRLWGIADRADADFVGKGTKIARNRERNQNRGTKP